MTLIHRFTALALFAALACMPAVSAHAQTILESVPPTAADVLNASDNGNGEGNRDRDKGNGNKPEDKPVKAPDEPAPPVAEGPPAPQPITQVQVDDPGPVPVPEPVPVEEPEPLTPATINRPAVTPAPPSNSGSTLVASAGTIEAGSAAIFPYARSSRSPLAPEVVALLIAGAAALVRGASLVRRESLTLAPA
jgi:hypothetical protein